MTTEILDAKIAYQQARQQQFARTVAKWCGAAEATSPVGEADPRKPRMNRIFYVGRMDALREEDNSRANS